jgi:hypothetical protein
MASYVLKAALPAVFPGSKTTKAWRFVVDTKAPNRGRDAPGR